MCMKTTYKTILFNELVRYKMYTAQIIRFLNLDFVGDL